MALKRYYPVGGNVVGTAEVELDPASLPWFMRKSEFKARRVWVGTFTSLKPELIDKIQEGMEQKQIPKEYAEIWKKWLEAKTYSANWFYFRGTLRSGCRGWNLFWLMPPGYTWCSPDRPSVARTRGRKGNIYRLYGAAVSIRVSAPKTLAEYLKEFELSQTRAATDQEKKALKKEWKRGRKLKRALLLFIPGNPTSAELNWGNAVGAGLMASQVLIDQVGKDAAASESMKASVEGSQKIIKVQTEEIHKLQDTVAGQAAVIEFLQRSLAQAKISVEIPSTLVPKPMIPSFSKEEAEAPKRRVDFTAWVLLSLAGWIVFVVGLGAYFMGIQQGVYDAGVLTLGLFGFIAGMAGLYLHIRKRDQELERQRIEKEKPPPTMPFSPSPEKVITEPEGAKD